MPPRIGLHRVIASTTLAVAHLGLAVAYASPTLTRGYPPPPGVVRVSVVSYLDSLGPTWQVGFGLTGALLAFGLYRHQLLALAHTLGGAAVAVYAAALWFGFAFSDPHPSVVSAVAYTLVMVWHLTIGVTYARLSDAPISRGHVDYPPEPGRASHRKGRR